MSDADDVILASGATEAAVTLATLSPSQILPLLYALVGALPDQAHGDEIPSPGQLFVNSDGFLVISVD